MTKGGMAFGDKEEGGRLGVGGGLGNLTLSQVFSALVISWESAIDATLRGGGHGEKQKVCLDLGRDRSFRTKFFWRLPRAQVKNEIY